MAPPPPAYIAFSGEGATLRGAGAAGTGGAFVFSEGVLAGVQVQPVDETAPTTTLQVKTVQGKKIKIR